MAMLKADKISLRKREAFVSSSDGNSLEVRSYIEYLSREKGKTLQGILTMSRIS
jgi:hypothetical protein